MKRIIVLFVAILIISPITAYASGRCTSRLFVVRNWKAPITLDSTTPDSTDEVETEEPGKPEEPTTPAPTDEVETMGPEETEEPEEHGGEPLVDDDPLPADDEQDIHSVEENEDGQDEPAADDHADAPDESDADEPPSPEPTTDQVEQSEEGAAVETPANDDEDSVAESGLEADPGSEPEEAGKARVDIGGAEGDGE